MALVTTLESVNKSTSNLPLDVAKIAPTLVVVGARRGGSARPLLPIGALIQTLEIVRFYMGKFYAEGRCTLKLRLPSLLNFGEKKWPMS